jgi:hypothetical protein
MSNKTQALHLDIQELGLMSNLLYTAMKATSKEFKDQPIEVQRLSNKIARAYMALEAKIEPKPKKEEVDFGSFKMTTISGAVKDAVQ